MKKYLLICAVSVLLVACAGTQRPLPPTETEIIQMSKEGVPADTIIQKMRESWAVYYLSASQLAKLKDQGVPEKVIDYMQYTQLEDARRQNYGPWPWGGVWGGSGGSGVGIGVGF
jgi:hypothetical protein